jgi:hypothetical protein
MGCLMNGIAHPRCDRTAAASRYTHPAEQACCLRTTREHKHHHTPGNTSMHAYPSYVTHLPRKQVEQGSSFQTSTSKAITSRAIVQAYSLPRVVKRCRQPLACRKLSCCWTCRLIPSAAMDGAHANGEQFRDSRRRPSRSDLGRRRHVQVRNAAALRSMRERR